METLKENKAVSKIKHFISQKQISLDSEILGSKGLCGNGCYTEWTLRVESRGVNRDVETYSANVS